VTEYCLQMVRLAWDESNAFFLEGIQNCGCHTRVLDIAISQIPNDENIR